MKERVILFSDAVVAIILTIMVVEFPIEIVDGQVKLAPLFMTIGIYFISFCFVGNLWFQTAQRFNLIEEVNNRDLIFYLISLFLLSLVPKATDLLIEETSTTTVLMYGILTLLVVFFTQGLIGTLTEQAVAEGKTTKLALEGVRKRGWSTIFARLLLLIVGIFLPRFSLVFYMILPILDFLRNAADQEETQFVGQMGSDQQQYYQEDQQQFWGSSWQKYGTLLRSALESNKGQPQAEAGVDPRQAWQEAFNRKWQERLEAEMGNLKQQIQASDQPAEQAALQARLTHLQQEQAQIQQRLKMTRQRFEQRAQAERQQFMDKTTPIKNEIDDLTRQQAATEDEKEQAQLAKKMAKAQEDYQKAVRDSQKRQAKNEERSLRRMDQIAKKTKH